MLFPEAVFVDLYKVVLVYFNKHTVRRNRFKKKKIFQSIDYGLLEKQKEKLNSCFSSWKTQKRHILTCICRCWGLTLRTVVQLHKPGDFSGSAGVWRQVEYLCNAFSLIPSVAHCHKNTGYVWSTTNCKKNRAQTIWCLTFHGFAALVYSYLSICQISISL